MKKYMSFLVLLTVFLPAFADDVTAVVTETSPGLSNGQVDITVTGGVAPYQFNWSGPGGFTATTEDISGLDSGSYTVTVTDQYCGVAVLTVWVGTEVNTYAPVLSDASSLHVYPSPFHETVVITSEKR